MSKRKLNVKNAYMYIEIQTKIPEKFLNMLWKRNIYVSNVKRKSLTSICMKIKLKDYNEIIQVCQKTNSKLKVLNREGTFFLFINPLKKYAIVIGIGVFIGMIYFLSNFIWKINVYTDKYVSPYEIKNQIKKYGIKEGISKNNINVQKLENKILIDNENIIWVKARVEGAKLNIKIVENKTPPKIEISEEPNNLIAKKDGEIVRVYTESGTAIIKEGDIVKKGDLLVKGEEGKEEEYYPVPSRGKVIAKTFYEKTKEVPLKYKKKVKTGKKIENIYISINGKRIYIKKHLNKFSNYDKIEYNKKFINKEIIYEVNNKEINRNYKEVINGTCKKLYNEIVKDIDKSVKIEDKIVDYNIEGDICKVRLLLIAEEDISEPDYIKDISKS